MTLRELLTKVGFRGQALEIAIGVARAESGGNAKAHNPNAGTGDNSYGLFQINMLGDMGPERRARYGLASNEDLFDPETNAKVAFSMSGGGKNWGPWTTFTHGLHRKFFGTDLAITNGETKSTTTAGGTGATNADPAGLFGLPTLSDAGQVATKVLIVGVFVAAGAGMVLLGVNKAAGFPGVKAAKALI